MSEISRRDEFAYTRLAKELKHAILKGSIKPGEMIPSENRLCEIYEISRSSVRKALEALVAEGLIYKVAGKGNFVSGSLGLATDVQTLKVGIYTPGLDSTKILRALDIFQKQHPLVKVQAVRISSTETYAQTVADLAEEGGLDAFLVTEHDFHHFRPGEDLLDLQPFLPPGWSTERDSYPQVFGAFEAGKGLYAMPIVFSPVVMCYNRELFDGAGVPYPDATWTWDDLVTAAKRLTVSGGPYGFCFSSSLNRWPIWLMQNGVQLKAPRKRAPDLQSPQLLEAVQFAADLMEKHGVSPVYGTGMDHAAEDLFVRRRAAMVLTTYFYLNDFFDLGFKWDVAEPPRGRNQATLLLTLGIAVSARSRQQELAQGLARYFLQESTQQFLKQEGCSIPVLRRVAEARSNINPSIHPAGYFTFQRTMPYAHRLDSLGERRDLQLLGRELALFWAGMEPAAAPLRRAEERLKTGER